MALPKLISLCPNKPKTFNIKLIQRAIKLIPHISFSFRCFYITLARFKFITHIQFRLIATSCT